MSKTLTCGLISLGLLSAQPSLAGQLIGKCLPSGKWIALVDEGPRVRHAGAVELAADSPSRNTQYRYEIDDSGKTAAIYEIYKQEILIASAAPVLFLSPEKIVIQHQFEAKYVFTHALDLKSGYGEVTELQFLDKGIQNEGVSLLCLFSRQ